MRIRSGPMTILHTESSLGWGGQELRILNESTGLIRRGHRAMLVCPPEARIFGEASRRGLPVSPLPIGRKGVRGVLALSRWLRSHPCDVVNTHSSTDSWLAAVACSLQGGAPAVVRTRHVSAPVSASMPNRWLYGRAVQAVVTTGDSIRRHLIDTLGLDASRVFSIPTGVDAVRFHPVDASGREAARRVLGLETGPGPVVGIVATLRSWKGHRFLIDAFARWSRSRPQARLLIVGDGPQAGALGRQVAALEIQDRVRLVGHRDDVELWMQSFDCFVLPSYANEGVPQALIQAMLTGLPCLTTGAGSIGEIARHDDTAWVVASESADAIVAGLDRLTGDPVLAARLGSAARASCEEGNSEAAMLDRMEEVFAAAVERAGRR